MVEIVLCVCVMYGLVYELFELISLMLCACLDVRPHSAIMKKMCGQRRKENLGIYHKL